MVDPSRIWNSVSLPTLPSVAVRLLDVSRDPDAEIQDVVAVIRQDPAIAARILKATNSAYFGFRHEVTSIDRAVPLLGTTVVTSLALSFSLVEAAMTTGPMVAHYRNYWMQSVVQGVAAEALCQHSKDGLECEFFLAGLLTDLGRLAMLKTIPEEYRVVLEQVEAERMALTEAEQARLGFDHVMISQKLMEKWGLPPSLREAVKLHHSTVAELKEHEPDGPRELVRALMLASSMGDFCCGADSGPALNRLRELSSELYDFSEEQLQEFILQVRTSLDSAAELFSVNPDEVPEPEDLLAQANEHLAELAMREHMAGSQAAARSHQAELEKKELELANHRLQQQAMHDPLTRIYNRQFFDETLGREVDRARREAQPIGVIFCDIDHFKQLNDNYGHRFGDFVLQKVAAAFSAALGKSDVLARYGGEEFVVIVSQPTEKGLARLSERIRAMVQDSVIESEGVQVQVTVSVGAALAMPGRDAARLAETLVVEADAAMYDSKRNGRNQVHVRSLLSEFERRMAARVLEQRFSRWLVARNAVDIPGVSRAVLKCTPNRVRIGELAQRQGWLTPDDIQQILDDQNASKERFGEVAIRLSLLTEQQVGWMIALQQEDPADLARALVGLELLERDQADQLRQEFEASFGGQAVTA
ncbi:MAG: HDOD domain-containing protein [Planctomycetaceae bacterium]|nr:HDOD domain-containing protein [Planctomycetaceae bacterium]